MQSLSKYVLVIKAVLEGCYKSKLSILILSLVNLVNHEMVLTSKPNIKPFGKLLKFSANLVY